MWKCITLATLSLGAASIATAEGEARADILLTRASVLEANYRTCVTNREVLVTTARKAFCDGFVNGIAFRDSQRGEGNSGNQGTFYAGSSPLTEAELLLIMRGNAGGQKMNIVEAIAAYNNTSYPIALTRAQLLQQLENTDPNAQIYMTPSGRIMGTILGQDPSTATEALARE